jgi:hypothetical protein
MVRSVHSGIGWTEDGDHSSAERDSEVERPTVPRGHYIGSPKDRDQLGDAGLADE